MPGVLLGVLGNGQSGIPNVKSAIRSPDFQTELETLLR